MSEAKQKIFILTAPLGGGHVATANALAACFQLAFPDKYDVRVIDVLKVMKLGTSLDKIAVPMYSGSVTRLNSYPWRFFFKFSDANPTIVNNFFTTILRDQASSYLIQRKPDLIISTFPIVSYAVTRLMVDKLVPRVPTFSIATDAGDIHKLWLGGDDHILVSTPETIDYAVRQGVDRNKLHYLGFPVSPAFFNLPEQAEVRRKHGLEPDRLTILFSGGGLGLNTKLVQLARRLSKEPDMNAQFIFVGGRNPRVVAALEKLHFKVPVKIYSHVSFMPELIAASDLVVGKAGWISLYEAMVARKPTIIINVIPGQEEPNAEFIQTHGVGCVEREVEGAIGRLIDYMQHPEKILAYQSAFDRLGLDPEAGVKIARFIAEALPKQ